MATKSFVVSARVGLSAALALALLSGCKSKGDLVSGFKVVRSICPAVAVPAHTGDITLFSPEGSRDASAIDVVATVTNLKSTCNEAAGEATITAQATFDVLGRRTNPAGARDVVLPYFSVVTQGGVTVVAKRLGQVTLHFTDGQLRAQASGTARADIQRSAATLPAEINEKITRQRRVGDADAAIDPMADPKVRTAVRAASFELLVGFQMTEAQLAYNATK